MIFKILAQKKLHEYEDRITYIQNNFCSDWESEIKKTPNVITSSSAIHHLLNNDKKKLYSKCYDILEENGWFFNIDEMKTLNEDAYLKSLYYWVYHTEKLKCAFSDDYSDEYFGWMEKFNKWKKRNVDNIHFPKQEGDDIHESFLVQLEWLKKNRFQKY